MSNVSTTVEELFDRYIAVWNEPDANRRRALIDTVWAVDGMYRDPVLSGNGREGIDAMTAGFQAAYPGHTFVRHGAPIRSGETYTFEWRLHDPEGELQLTGKDTAKVDGDGLLRSIVGEFDLPDAAG